MWDPTNAGAQDPKRIQAYFGCRGLLDGATAYTIGFHFQRKRNIGGMLFG